MFATSMLVQYSQDPTRAHLEAAKQVVHYLKTTCDLELTYGSSDATIIGYSDADHTSQLHQHSISGYVFLIGGGAMAWSSKKQPTVAIYSTEAENIASCHGMNEAVWLHSLLKSLGYTQGGESCC